MATVPLEKPARVGAVDQGSFGSGIASDSGAAFERGDLIAHMADGEWEKADGDWDVAASGPLFALAINNPRADAYTVPIFDSGGTAYGNRFGPDRDNFDFAHLDGVEVEINVDDGTDLTRALLGDYYGLLYDSTAGVMQVDLSDTTNETFFVRDIAPVKISPSVGKINVIGDDQVRVRGHFHPDVCY